MGKVMAHVSKNGCHLFLPFEHYVSHMYRIGNSVEIFCGEDGLHPLKIESDSFFLIYCGGNEIYVRIKFMFTKQDVLFFGSFNMSFRTDDAKQHAKDAEIFGANTI